MVAHDSKILEDVEVVFPKKLWSEAHFVSITHAVCVVEIVLFVRTSHIVIRPASRFVQIFHISHP